MTTNKPEIIHLPNGSVIDRSLPTREQVKSFKAEQRAAYLKANPMIAAKLKAK